MMILFVLLGAFVTAAALAWGLSGASEVDVGSRALRYATETFATETIEGDGPALRVMPGWLAFLEQAGVSWTPGQALFMAATHAVGGLVLGAVIGLPWLGFVAGIGVLYGRLRIGRTRRIRQLAEQLPDALMLLGTALKSGFGFQQALQLVSREGALPLSTELGRLGTDMALGLNLEEALMRLQTRLGSADGEMLTAALLVQRQTGGNLSELLMNLHDTIRDRQTVQGQVRTLTAQGRLSGIVLTLIPLAIALAFYILNRDYLMMLVTDPRGRLMSVVSAVLLVFGMLGIRRIVNITL